MSETRKNYLENTVYELVTEGVNHFGTYTSVIENPNLIDQSRPYGFYLPRFIRNLRLKEWQAFQLISDNYFMIGAVYNTKLAGVSQCIIFEIDSGKIYNFSRKTLPFDQHTAWGLDRTVSYYKSKEHTMAIGNDQASGKFSIYCHHDYFMLKGSGYLSGDVLSFYHPLKDGNGVYSLKAAMPFNGFIDLGLGKKMLKNASLIIDDHKGYYNRRMEYRWATGAKCKDGQVTAFNLCQNHVKKPDIYNENVLWHKGELHHFGPVHVEILDHCWMITDEEQRIHLMFYPKADYKMYNNYGLFKVDYLAPMGYFEGAFKLKNGRVVDIEKFLGMTEWINNVL